MNSGVDQLMEVANSDSDTESSDRIDNLWGRLELTDVPVAGGVPISSDVHPVAMAGVVDLMSSEEESQPISPASWPEQRSLQKHV